MSEDAPVSRKDKKAQRDAERRKGGKKRKREQDGEEEQPNPVNSAVDAEQNFIPLDDGDVEAPKAKKRRKAKTSSTKSQGHEDGDPSTSTTKPRFILFIGNLPYSTTDASLQAYFSKIAPFTLRHRTDPKTKASKGFAFLEFENFDRMKTCLKLYHHTMFNPAQYEDSKNVAQGGKKVKDSGGRRINVELTAGGGGKAEGRMEKIKAKNVKLDEQRKRRAEAERKEREKEKREGRGVKKKEGGDGGAGDGEKSAARDDTAQIHPSRLARVQG